MIDRVLTSLFCSNMLIGNHAFPTYATDLFSVGVEMRQADSPTKQEDLPKTSKELTKSDGSLKIASIAPVAVAIALGAGAVGTKQEYAWLENLERVSSNSTGPKTFVHNLGLTARSAKSLCNEHRYALVLTIEYPRGSETPLLISRDCQLHHELTSRSIDAVTQIDLIGQIWSEHQLLSRVDSGSKRRPMLNRRLRDGLIAGGAVLIVGGAIAIVFAATLRKQQAVLTVSPNVPTAR